MCNDCYIYQHELHIKYNTFSSKTPKPFNRACTPSTSNGKQEQGAPHCLVTLLAHAVAFCSTLPHDVKGTSPWTHDVKIIYQIYTPIQGVLYRTPLNRYTTPMVIRFHGGGYDPRAFPVPTPLNCLSWRISKRALPIPLIPLVQGKWENITHHIFHRVSFPRFIYGQLMRHIDAETEKICQLALR